MDTEQKKDVEVYGQSDKQLAYKEKTVNDVTQFAQNKKDEMQQLIDSFKAKGKIGLWWDSKVPENDKRNQWWFNCFSFLEHSDQEAVVKELEDYLEFYEEIKGIENVKDADDAKSVDEAYLQIKGLYRKLSSMVKTAKREKGNTNSRTVYNAHMDIIKREEQIEHKIERVELSISRQQIQSLTNQLESAVETCKRSEEQINILWEENKEIKEECRKVIERNAKLEEECRKSTEESRKTREELQSFMQELFNYMGHRRTAQNEADNQGASTSKQQPYVQGANQESGAQAAATVYPDSKLDGVQPISRSQSLDSSHSNDSDVEIISRSQCR